ncbi:hypothetical protein MMC16_001406 [Acarospora aff. strigata]|nr:hypothetical protein [Acarospora aff. strigata]
MSSSITIPKRKCLQPNPAQAFSSSSSSYTSPFSRTPQTMSSPSTPVDAKSSRPMYDRRPSLLSSSLSKQEHTVVNVGHPDGPPRLITCVKASQGFDWNQGMFNLFQLRTYFLHIFLPSYADRDSSELERRKDPVHDIILTEEEANSVFPS